MEETENSEESLIYSNFKNKPYHSSIEMSRETLRNRTQKKMEKALQVLDSENLSQNCISVM